MKKRLITVGLICLVAVLCCMFIGCTKLNENMFPTNGSGRFTDSSVDEMKQNFELISNGTTADTSVFSVKESDDNDDEYILSVSTSSTGNAYVGKKIKVTGGCYYSIHYSIMLKSSSEYTSGVAYDGVHPAILEDNDLDFVKTGAIINTTTDFQDYKMSFRAKESGYATVVLMFGTKDAPAKIDAEIKAFSVKRVSKNVAEESNFVGEFISDYYGQVDDFNTFYIVMGAALTIAVCVAAYIMLRRDMALSAPELNGEGYRHPFLLKLKNSSALSVGMFIAIGLFVRMLIDILSTSIASGFNISKVFIGYNAQGIATQALFIAKHGPQYLLQSAGGAFASDAGYTVSGVSSSPLQLYFLGFCGLFGRIFEKSNPYMATLFFIRFFESLADVGAAYILYSILVKHSGRIGATVVAAVYLCLPIVFAGSSLWGYTESLTALMIILTVKFMLDNNYIGTAIAFFVAFMFSQTALFLAPFVMFYTVLVCIKSVKMREYKNLIAAGSILVLAFFVYYALSVPFAINYIQNEKAFYWFEYAWDELYKGALYTINAFNFQAVLGNNMTEVTTSSLVVTIIFILFMLGLAGFAYFKFKNRMNLILLATTFINMMFVFANDMNPMSMYISLILMLMYAIMNKEKRIFFSFVAFATLMFINVSYVELLVPFTASSAPVWTGNPAVMYVFSAFEMLFALYYVYIVYDIVVSRKVRKISPLGLTFVASVKNFFLRIEKKYYKFKMEHKR